MRRNWIPIAAVLLVGCSGGTNESGTSTPKDNFDGLIDYTAATREDSRGTWQASGYQPSGEEKIIFSKQIGKAPAAELSPTSLVIEGPKEDVAAVGQMLNSLRTEARRTHLPIRKFGLAPFGLTNDLYFGHTFWDMDVWMLPALLFIEPNAVKDMVQYRIDRSATAAENAQTYFKRKDIKIGMMFPWESSVSGKETVPGPSRMQHHISGSVLWGMTQAEAIGLVERETTQPIAEGVSNFFAARSVKTERGFEIKDVMSPDEHHTGDNDLFTNLLAQWARNDRKWKGRINYYLPRDNETFLTYENDQLKSYKQAAAVLSIYPLQYPEAEAQARKMLERFESKVIKNGPAMTDSVHATIWARLGEREKAYKAWRQCWKPFVSHPKGYFSEKSRRSRTYFYTGAAGALNTVLYGFLGIRLSDQEPSEFTTKRKLKSGYWLSMKPCLPELWTKIELRNVLVDGEKVDFVASKQAVTLTKSKN